MLGEETFINFEEYELQFFCRSTAKNREIKCKLTHSRHSENRTV
jgi:hypothetical protein